MSTIITILKLAAVLLAAMTLGNWFQAEVKKAKAKQLPWYRPYMTLPGVTILAAIILPVIYWVAILR